MTINPNLTDLANRFGSDKGTLVGQAHGYTPLYEMILGPRRDSIKRMLEIGLMIGGPEQGYDPDRLTGDMPSVRMWLEYFPNAVIHGFDISDFSFFKDPRFVFTRGDSGSNRDLRRIQRLGVDFDFIIDDGSHASYHQQLAFMNLFPLLKSRGIYVIEDLHWQSPFYESKLPETFTTSEMFSVFFHTGGFPASRTRKLRGNEKHAKDISYAFVVNERSLEYNKPKTVIIQKR